MERRIDVANERMGYASDVVGTLRGALSERHGLVLEWMIIVLIAVEVGFEVNRLWNEREERRKVERGGRGQEKEKGKDAAREVLAAEMLTPSAAPAVGGVRTEEPEKVDGHKVRRELEEIVQLQRNLLNSLERMDKESNGQVVSTPATSSQSPGPEQAYLLAELPIQAVVPTE